MGRVAIKHLNITGYLCQHSEYTNENADALCRVLNFSNGGVILQNSGFLSRPTSYRNAWSGHINCKWDNDFQTLTTTDCFPYMTKENVYYENGGYYGNAYDDDEELSECGNNIASVACHVDYGKYYYFT